MKVEDISSAIQITVVTIYEIREHLEGYIQIIVVTIYESRDHFESYTDNRRNNI